MAQHRWQAIASSLSDLGPAWMELADRREERQSRRKHLDLESQKLEAELKRMQRPYVQGGMLFTPDESQPGGFKVEPVPAHHRTMAEALQEMHQAGDISDEQWESYVNSISGGMTPWRESQAAAKQGALSERERVDTAKLGQGEQRLQQGQARLGMERQRLGMSQERLAMTQQRYQNAMKAPGGKAGSTEFERNLAWLKHNDPDFTDEQEQEMRKQRLLRQEGQTESMTMQFQGGATPSQETIRKTGPAAGMYQQHFTEAMQAFSALQGPGMLTGRGKAPTEEQALALVEQQDDPQAKKAWADAYRRRFPKGKPVGKAAAPKISEESLAPEAPKAPKAAGKTLDEATARKFLQQAGGDKEKARKLARDAGYDF